MRLYEIKNPIPLPTIYYACRPTVTKQHTQTDTVVDVTTVRVAR